MVFSFFKKAPPEKMVAKPAAVPPPSVDEPEAAPMPAGAGKEVAAAAGQSPVGAAAASVATPAAAPAAPSGELPSLDFTAGSGFSNFSDTPGEIRIDGDIDPVQSEVEQAVVLYANGQDEQTRAMLENAIRVWPPVPGERFWLMLFDFYRLKGLRAEFEALGLDYARGFEKSPPVWPAAGQAVPPSPERPPAGSLPFRGDLIGASAPVFVLLEQAIDRQHALCLDLSGVKSVDPAGAERLLTLLERARRNRRRVTLVGCEGLAERLDAQLRDGLRGARACWLLLLETLQALGRREAFEERAIDYAVRFEMSPPSWEVAPAGDAAPETLPVAAGAPAPAGTYVLSGELKAERFSDLPAFAQSADSVLIDLSGVVRIDFVSAGTLVNLLTSLRRDGRQVVIRHPNRLVAELLGVVGIHAVAGIEHARH